MAAPRERLYSDREVLIKAVATSSSIQDFKAYGQEAFSGYGISFGIPRIPRAIPEDANFDLTSFSVNTYCVVKNMDCGPRVISMDAEIVADDLRFDLGEHVSDDRTGHIIPLALGGEDCENNRFLLEENSNDGVKTLSKYLEVIGRLWLVGLPAECQPTVLYNVELVYNEQGTPVEFRYTLDLRREVPIKGKKTRRVAELLDSIAHKLGNGVKMQNLGEVMVGVETVTESLAPKGTKKTAKKRRVDVISECCLIVNGVLDLPKSVELLKKGQFSRAFKLFLIGLTNTAVSVMKIMDPDDPYIEYVRTNSELLIKGISSFETVRSLLAS